MKRGIDQLGSDGGGGTRVIATVETLLLKKAVETEKAARGAMTAIATTAVTRRRVVAVRRVARGRKVMAVGETTAVTDRPAEVAVAATARSAVIATVMNETEIVIVTGADAAAASRRRAAGTVRMSTMHDSGVGESSSIRKARAPDVAAPLPRRWLPPPRELQRAAQSVSKTDVCWARPLG